MIRKLCTLKGIGAQSATVLVREGFVREFRSGRALGSYAGLTGTPWASGGMAREQGISKAGNRHLRTAVVELARMWRRWQPVPVHSSETPICAYAATSVRPS